MKNLWSLECLFLKLTKHLHKTGRQESASLSTVVVLLPGSCLQRARTTQEGSIGRPGVSGCIDNRPAAGWWGAKAFNLPSFFGHFDPSTLGSHYSPTGHYLSPIFLCSWGIPVFTVSPLHTVLRPRRASCSPPLPSVIYKSPRVFRSWRSRSKSWTPRSALSTKAMEIRYLGHWSTASSISPY